MKTARNGKGQFLVYEAENGQIKIDVRLENETVWLTQPLMAELFQTPHSGYTDIRTPLLPEDHRYLRHEHRLRPDTRSQYCVLQDGAKQDAYETFHGHRIAERDKIGNAFDSLVGQLPASKPRQADEDDAS
jgi:hypothetical protein